MKKLLSVVLSVCFVILSVCAAFAAGTGTIYYIDALSGNDAAAGTSPETAWKTLAKAAGVSLSPGDKVLLKRGCVYEGGAVFTGKGTAEAPILFSAYGEGALPVLTVSERKPILPLNNVSWWTVENLDLTAPNGAGGVWIAATGNENAAHITVKNCVIHDIAPNLKADSNAAVYIANDRSASRVRDVHLDGLRISNVAWGVQMNGIMAEFRESGFISSEVSYNRDYLIENLFVRRAVFGGLVAASVQDCLVRSCRFLECAVSDNGALAPLWIRHADRVTVEYCEIAGSDNVLDGMAIDFDGWTTNSTYRYIYSHDNTRFMRNCVYDSRTKNAGNSVYRCVSVNDSGLNHAASVFVSLRAPSLSRMSGFTFRDNILVNSGAILWFGAANPQVSNISFSGNAFQNILQKFLNAVSSVSGFTYGVDDAALNAAIAEITANLPNS